VAVFASGEVVNDSSDIIDSLLTKFGGASRNFTSQDALKWSKWSTDKLAVYMYPNITRTFSECRSALSYFSNAKGIGAFDAFLTQTVGAFGMSMAHGKIKKKYGIVDERASLWSALDEWSEELDRASPSCSFHGGNRPDIGDVSVWGVLNAAQGLPLFEEMKAHGSGRVGKWMKSMAEVMPTPKIVS
jgi:microsomal prostaglandin-E synthase 2